MIRLILDSIPASSHMEGRYLHRHQAKTIQPDHLIGHQSMDQRKVLRDEDEYSIVPNPLLVGNLTQMQEL